MLKILNVTKSYQKKAAVDHVSFEVAQGSIFGLLGPNGAGKTTLIRMINQIFFPDSGEIYLNEEKLGPKHIGMIGYMPEERGLYPQMKVAEQIIYLAQLKGLNYKQAKQKTNFWLDKFDIKDWSNKKITELSKGMQQKIQFITTVIHEPKLLILDEPLSGLDPINANLINSEINALQKKGTTVIFSTHRMEQVEEICQNIVLIDEGKKVLDGNVQEIKSHFKKNLFKVDYVGTTPARLLKSNFTIKEVTRTHLIFQLNQGQTPTLLIKYLIDEGLQITGVNEILPTLNEIFIEQVQTHSK